MVWNNLSETHWAPDQTVLVAIGTLRDVIGFSDDLAAAAAFRARDESDPTATVARLAVLDNG